jgi:hypothetical protein
MADQEHSDASKRAMEQKPHRNTGGKADPAHDSPGSHQQDRQRGSKPGAVVGRDVPDESKERHTEIAVEAGRSGGEHRDSKR